MYDMDPKFKIGDYVDVYINNIKKHGKIIAMPRNPINFQSRLIHHCQHFVSYTIATIIHSYGCGPNKRVNIDSKIKSVRY